MMKNNIKKIDAHVGMQLKLLRTMEGLSRKSLGDIIDVSGEQVRKYETGENRISAGALYQIGIFFNKQVSYFFEGYALKIISQNNSGKQLVTINNKLYALEEIDYSFAENVTQS